MLHSNDSRGTFMERSEIEAGVGIDFVRWKRI